MVWLIHIGSFAFFSLLNHNCTCFLRRFSSFFLSWKEKKVKLKQIDNRCTALPASHCFAIRSSICQSRGWKVSFKNSRFYITRSIWLEGTIKKPLSYFLSSWNLGNSRSGGGVGGQDIYFDDASWIALCYLVNNDTYCTTFLIEMTADVFVCLVLKLFFA